MTRLSNLVLVLVVLVALAPYAAAQSGGREPESLDSLWLGEQVSGDRLSLGDLEGRVVLAYHWCVS